MINFKKEVVKPIFWLTPAYPLILLLRLCCQGLTPSGSVATRWVSEADPPLTAKSLLAVILFLSRGKP